MKPGMKMLMISGMDKKRDNEYNMESRYRNSRGWNIVSLEDMRLKAIT